MSFYVQFMAVFLENSEFWRLTLKVWLLALKNTKHYRKHTARRAALYPFVKVDGFFFFRSVPNSTHMSTAGDEASATSAAYLR